MNKKWIISAAGVLALSASLAVAAPEGFGGEGHGHRGHRGRGFMSEKLARKLNLTDAQKAQLKDLRQAAREENKAFYEQAHATFKDFRAAKEANDTAKMESLKPTVEANRAQMKQLREAQHQKFLSVLTAEQRAQLEQIQAERRNNKQ